MNHKLDMDTNTQTIPRSVYNRCVWLVRDSYRLRQVADAMHADYGYEVPETGCEEFPAAAVMIDEAACMKAQDDLKCIEAALVKVPEAYRQGIINNIADKAPFSDLAHPNTWKKWKRTFIFELARETHML